MKTIAEELLAALQLAMPHVALAAERELDSEKDLKAIQAAMHKAISQGVPLAVPQHIDCSQTFYEPYLKQVPYSAARAALRKGLPVYQTMPDGDEVSRIWSATRLCAVDRDELYVLDLPETVKTEPPEKINGALLEAARSQVKAARSSSGISHADFSSIAHYRTLIAVDQAEKAIAAGAQVEPSTLSYDVGELLTEVEQRGIRL